MIVDLIFSVALIVVCVWGIKYLNKREDERSKRSCEIIGTRIANAITSAMNNTDN